jgi:hypothetical protein
MPKDNIILFAQKHEGKRFQFEMADDLVNFEAQALPGRYVFEIKRSRPPKTQKQLGVIFGLMIGQAVEQAQAKCIGVEELMRYLLTRDIPKGVAITKDYLHALLYIICPTFNDKGKEITLRDMNTLQAADVFERFRNILAPLGIVIDDPDPNWRNK